MTTKYVIRYTSRSTVGGEPVGEVYVKDVRESIPGYPMEAYSYTKNVYEATRWEYEAGVEAIRTKSWPAACLVLAGQAAVTLT